MEKEESKKQWQFFMVLAVVLLFSGLLMQFFQYIDSPHFALLWAIAASFVGLGSIFYVDWQIAELKQQLEVS